MTPVALDYARRATHPDTPPSVEFPDRHGARGWWGKRPDNNAPVRRTRSRSRAAQERQRPGQSPEDAEGSDESADVPRGSKKEARSSRMARGQYAEADEPRGIERRSGPNYLGASPNSDRGHNLSTGPLRSPFSLRQTQAASPEQSYGAGPSHRPGQAHLGFTHQSASDYRASLLSPPQRDTFQTPPRHRASQAHSPQYFPGWSPDSNEILIDDDE